MIADLNNSGAQTALRCLQKFHFDYIDKIYSPSTFEQGRGTILHRLRSFNLNQKIKTKHDLELDDLHQLVNPFMKEIEVMPSRDGLQLEKVVRRGLEVDYNLFQRNIKPLLVEERIRVRFKDQTFSVNGQIDLLPENMRLVDLKTSKSSPNQLEIHNSPQISLYLALCRAAGFTVGDAELQYLVFSKYTVQPAVVTTHRTGADIKSALDQLQSVVDIINTGRITGAPAGSWYCSPRWCQHYFRCPFITKMAKQVCLGQSGPSKPEEPGQV